MRPALLRPDNFTPPARTPWGGTRIISRYKAELLLDDPPAVVGEAWEVSVEPSFPSRLVDSGELLADVIARAPKRWLGAAAAARYGGQTPLLVKLLDAADDLSVQVHPADGDAGLADGESGKPEAWVILDVDPGAGIYLGFREGVGRAEVARRLEGSGPLGALLNFVPVAAGDVFVVPAGTPHAIGAGITLLEPQLVRPGRRGVTYRFWDWNRRYDAVGRRDPAGQPRALHVARSLAVTDWDAPGGDALVARCRGASGGFTTELEAPLTRRLLVDWPFFEVEVWEGTGSLRMPCRDTLWALTCVEGEAVVGPSAGAHDPLTLRRGQSAVVPAAARELLVQGRGARVLATRTPR